MRGLTPKEISSLKEGYGVVYTFKGRTVIIDRADYGKVRLFSEALDTVNAGLKLYDMVVRKNNEGGFDLFKGGKQVASLPKDIGKALIFVNGENSGFVQPGNKYYDERLPLLDGVAAIQDTNRGFVEISKDELEEALRGGYIKAIEVKGEDGKVFYKFEINGYKDFHCPLHIGLEGVDIMQRLSRELYTLPITGSNGNFKLVTESDIAAARDRGEVKLVEYGDDLALAVEYRGDMASKVTIGKKDYALVGIPLYSMYLEHALKSGAAKLGSDGNVYFDHNGKHYTLLDGRYVEGSP